MSYEHWDANLLVVFATLLAVGLVVLLHYEGLTGFVMLTWSASFTYLEMARFWRK